jgi:multidrug efflux system membrane fusion protein
LSPSTRQPLQFCCPAEGIPAEAVGEAGAPPPHDVRRTDWKPRRGWLAWLLAALGVLVLAILVWRLIFPPKKPAPPPQPVPVGVAKVVSGDLDVELRGIGTVTPVATITVQALVSGLLMKVGFREGQIVRKDQFLAQIDPRPFQNQLDQSRGTLVHDTGLLGQAKSDLARFLILGRQNSIAQQQVADQQYLVRQTEGTVMQDRALVNTARLNLYYAHILSPVTGRVGLRLVDPGNYIQVGNNTALAVVTQLEPITVIFVLPENQVGPVLQQLQSGQRLEVAAWDAAGSQEIAKGELLTVDNTADTTTGTVKLRASFPNTDLKLFPNEFVNARLRLKTLSGVTIAPLRAIQHGAPGTFVYLLEPGGMAHVQVIQTGASQAEEVQVLSGLKPGDTVIVDGVDRLREGARVRVEQAARNPPANTGPGAPPGQQPQNSAPVRGRARRPSPSP